MRQKANMRRDVFSFFFFLLFFYKKLNRAVRRPSLSFLSGPRIFSIKAE